MSRPTIEELKEFARLPWVTCTCLKRFTRAQHEGYRRLLAEKEETYYDTLEREVNRLFDYNDEQIAAGRSNLVIPETKISEIAEKEANRVADLEFNRRVKEELKISRLCCFNALAEPQILPLGVGIDLDPDVMVGERLSQQIALPPGTEPAARVQRVRTYTGDVFPYTKSFKESGPTLGTRRGKEEVIE